MDAWSEMPRQLDKPTALVWILSTFFFIIPFFCTAVNGKQHRRFLISPASEAEEEKKCKTGQAAEALERHLLSSEFADSQVSAFLDGQTVGNRAVILWMYRRLLMWCRIF